MTEVDALFSHFRQELDDYHNQRERVIKASRDITASSKKVIFALQRVKDLENPDNLSDSTVQKLMNDIKERIDSVKSDVTGEINQWRYYKQFTGCIQEYIEAITFQYYLQHRRVMSYPEVSETLPGILITKGDYILGLMDLTGELMRYAIAHLSDGDGGPSGIALSILSTLRQFKSELGTLDIDQAEKSLRIKEFGKKISVFNASLSKVEQAMYSLQVRRLEIGSL